MRIENNDLISRSWLLKREFCGRVSGINVRLAPAVPAVPLDYHERCLELEVKRRFAAEKTARQCIENYVPVRHGKWQIDKDTYLNWSIFACSVCDAEFVLNECEEATLCLNYCPECGAKMDSEANDDEP